MEPSTLHELPLLKTPRRRHRGAELHNPRLGSGFESLASRKHPRNDLTGQLERWSLVGSQKSKFLFGFSLAGRGEKGGMGRRGGTGRMGGWKGRLFQSCPSCLSCPLSV